MQLRSAVNRSTSYSAVRFPYPSSCRTFFGFFSSPGCGVSYRSRLFAPSALAPMQAAGHCWPQPKNANGRSMGRSSVVGNGVRAHQCLLPMVGMVPVSSCVTLLRHCWQRNCRYSRLTPPAMVNPTAIVLPTFNSVIAFAPSSASSQSAQR
jgi:hypothetical protein